MLRNAALETGPPISPCRRLPAKAISECDEGDSCILESSEADAAGEQRSFERPAYSSFTSQRGDSSQGDLRTWARPGDVMFSGGSAFATNTGNLSDDSDDGDKPNTRTAQPRRQQLQQLHPPLLELNSMQELLGILTAPSSGANPLSLRPFANGNAVDGAMIGLAGSPAAQQQQQQQEQGQQQQQGPQAATDLPLLANIDSNHLPDFSSLLQTLGSHSRPYGVGLVPSEVIRAQLIFSAIAAQPTTGDGESEGAAVPSLQPPAAAVAAETAAAAAGTFSRNPPPAELPAAPPPSADHPPAGTSTARQSPPAADAATPLVGRSTPPQLWLEPQSLQRLGSPSQPQQQPSPPQQQEQQEEQQHQAASPAVDLARSLLVLPLERRRTSSATPPPLPPKPPSPLPPQHQQGQLPPPYSGGDSLSVPGIGSGPDLNAGGGLEGGANALESRPSFTGNNDELIAAMAAAGLGSAAAGLELAAAAGPVAAATAAMAAAASAATAATHVDASAPATTATDAAGLCVDVGAFGSAAAAAVRPPEVGSGVAMAFGRRQQLQPQPPWGSAPGPRQRRYDSYGARGSSSGMAEFADEAALAGASMAGSVSGSAPGTPPVSPHGTATRPQPPWSASSSARSLQSHNMCQPPQQQHQQAQYEQQQHQQAQYEQHQQAQYEQQQQAQYEQQQRQQAQYEQHQQAQQQRQQQLMNPWLAAPPPLSYGYAPLPPPEPLTSSQMRHQRTASAGGPMDIDGGGGSGGSGGGGARAALAAATPAISVADGIAAAPPPPSFSPARPSLADHPASPFALVSPDRSLAFGGGPGSGGGGAFGGLAPAAGDGRRSADYRRRTENNNHSHLLPSFYSRETGSGAVSNAECSSGGAARFSLGGGGGCIPGANHSLSLSRGFTGSGGEGSISGCGLSGLTLGNSTGGAGSVGGSAGGSGCASAHKRSRVQPLAAAGAGAASRLPSVGGGVTEDEEGGGSSGGEGDDGGQAAGGGRTWRAEELPAPVAVLVTGLSREVGEDGRRRRITVHGIFHADRYLANQDCILYENKFISRSGFEKAGGSTTAKWHCSIKVAGTQSVTLGTWLSTKGLPVLKGGSRKSKRQRAVEHPPAPTNPSLQLQLPTPQHQQQQLQPRPRVSSGGSMSGALPISMSLSLPGTMGSPRHSAGSGGAAAAGGGGGGGDLRGPSGVSLSSWSHPHQQPLQPPPPLLSPRQQQQQLAPQPLPHLPYSQPQPHSQRQPQHPQHPQHGAALRGSSGGGNGSSNGGGGCDASLGLRLPTCPPVNIPPLQPLQPPRGGVPLPPMSSPPPQQSGQYYAPSAFALAQLSQSQPTLTAAAASHPAGRGGGGAGAGGAGAGGAVRSCSGFGPDGRPVSCSGGMLRPDLAAGGSAPPAPMSAPPPGGHHAYPQHHQQQHHHHHHHMMTHLPFSTTTGSGGNGGGGGGPGGGGERMQALYGSTAIGVYGGHPRSSNGGGADASGGGGGGGPRMCPLPPLPLQPPQGRQ